MKPITRLFLLIALALLPALPAAARETITSFISDVTVNTDGSLDVHETITVNSEAIEIRRGILRDIPTIYKNKSGTQMKVGLEVLEVQRDGRDEPFEVESISNGKRIKIGQADVYLKPTQHIYKITYHTARQIGFFDTFERGIVGDALAIDQPTSHAVLTQLIFNLRTCAVYHHHADL